jgi:hypothetical protein
LNCALNNQQLLRSDGIMIRKILQSALCTCMVPLLTAQQAVEPLPAGYRSQSSMVPGEVIVPKGTRIDLVALESVSSASAKKNSQVQFALARDLVVNGVTILYAGAPVEATVSGVRLGVPGRRWGKLTIRIRKVQIGHHALLRLTSNNPQDHDSSLHDVAFCAAILPLCILLLAAFPDSAKPGDDGGQAVLAKCHNAVFWTTSDATISARDIDDGKTELAGRSPITCSNTFNQSRGRMEVK